MPLTDSCFRSGGFLKSSACGMTSVDLRFCAKLFPVKRGYPLAELRDKPGTDQIHGRSAEAPSGHASADHAVELVRGFHQEIEFAATYLVVVPKTPVGFVHQLAGACQIMSLQRGDEAVEPCVFADHVPRPPAQGLGKTLGVRRIGVAQRQAEHAGSLVAFLPPAVILAE